MTRFLRAVSVVLWTVMPGTVALAAPPPKAPAAQPSARELATRTQGHIKQYQLKEAEGTARQCVELYPADANCHLLLGSTLARLSQVEPAAKEYREFLRLAPDDPKAPVVKKFLEDYERSQSPKKERLKTDG